MRRSRGLFRDSSPYGTTPRHIRFGHSDPAGFEPFANSKAPPALSSLSHPSGYERRDDQPDEPHLKFAIGEDPRQKNANGFANERGGIRRYGKLSDVTVMTENAYKTMLYDTIRYTTTRRISDC